MSHGEMGNETRATILIGKKEALDAKAISAGARDKKRDTVTYYCRIARNRHHRGNIAVIPISSGCCDTAINRL
ncbi:hypothetical protein MJ524_13670 [Escherichia coli]|nr:hypothetical protein MJ524_13670 [Escherichia coli]